VKGTGTYLHIVRLQQHAALARPVILQRQDESLEGTDSVCIGGCHNA
jgi:hypothetical protein